MNETRQVNTEFFRREYAKHPPIKPVPDKATAEANINEALRDSENEGYTALSFDPQEAFAWLLAWKKARRTGEPQTYRNKNGNNIDVEPDDDSWFTKFDYEVDIPASDVAGWLEEKLPEALIRGNSGAAPPLP